MDILVNGIPLLAPMTGIGQYIRGLFFAMDALPDTHLHVCLGLRCESAMRLPSPGVTRSMQGAYGLARRLLPNPRALKCFVEAAAFRHHARRMPAGCLYHEPNFLPQPFAGPTVLTVHDLSCFDHPEAHPAERVRIMERDLPGALQRADHIIVVSEATGRELCRRFGLPPERLSVTPLAADGRFRPMAVQESAPQLAELGLAPGGYVLAVGTLEPRKNLPTLFAAYAALPAALRRRFPLVVAGMQGWHCEALLQSAQQLLARGELRLLGYVADALIPALYAGAAAFVYPSRYEGFGLPPLEAMACGVPVIAANRTSLPEVVGDAGILLDPDDVDAFRANLQRLLEDETEARQLAARGLERAASFSWARCARQTRAVYEQVVAHGGGAV